MGNLLKLREASENTFQRFSENKIRKGVIMQKTAKKVCSLLLALVMILGMLPISALATESGTTQWVGTDLQLGEDLTLRFYANTQRNSNYRKPK